MIEIQPQHINATPNHLEGNDAIGRYIFLTGSDCRAYEISKFFGNVEILKHPRQHNLYLGTLNSEHGKLDVASISSGMGGASADIIINELLHLGAKRILRVGTAGSLNPDKIQTGHLIIATAAVRDDKSTWDYIYPEYPAISSIEYIVSALRAADSLKSKFEIHSGIVHSKSSLYARELNMSSLVSNTQYMHDIKTAGVIATEMECAQLFVLSSLMNSKMHKDNSSQAKKILCGALLAIVGDSTPFDNNAEKIKAANDAVIELSLQTTKQISLLDKGISQFF